MITYDSELHAENIRRINERNDRADAADRPIRVKIHFVGGQPVSGEYLPLAETPGQFGRRSLANMLQLE